MADRKLVEEEIARHMPLERFIRLNKRLAELIADEERKLEALAELKNYFLSAGTEQEIQAVKDAVGQLREISRNTRIEMRAIRSEIAACMPLPLAKELYDRLKAFGL